MSQGSFNLFRQFAIRYAIVILTASPLCGQDASKPSTHPTSAPTSDRATQQVEGFDAVAFHHDASRSAASRDFRGMARGFMPAGWWAPGQMKDNRLAWRTAMVPAAKRTTFTFAVASSVLPAELASGRVDWSD